MPSIEPGKESKENSGDTHFLVEWLGAAFSSLRSTGKLFDHGGGVYKPEEQRMFNREEIRTRFLRHGEPPANSEDAST